MVGILEIKGKTSGGENQIIPLDFTHLSLSSVHHPVDQSEKSSLGTDQFYAPVEEKEESKVWNENIKS